MKGLYYLCFLLMIISCDKKEESANNKSIPMVEESTKSDNDTTKDGQLTIQEEPMIVEQKKIEKDSVEQNDSWLRPSFLSADFNGDNHLDTAFAITRDGKKGIKIKHGKTDEEFTIGAGIGFGNGGDDFDWVDNWNLVTDKKTFEVTFMESGDVDGSREVILDNTAFYIGSEEYGGATIAWKDGGYNWIHQAD